MSSFPFFHLIFWVLPLYLFSSTSCHRLVSSSFLLFLPPTSSFSLYLLLFHVCPFVRSCPFLPTISYTFQALLLLQCCFPLSSYFHSSIYLCAPGMSCHAGSMIFSQLLRIWQLLSSFLRILYWLSFRWSSSRRFSCRTPQASRRSPWSSPHFPHWQTRRCGRSRTRWCIRRSYIFHWTDESSISVSCVGRWSVSWDTLGRQQEEWHPRKLFLCDLW